MALLQVKNLTFNYPETLDSALKNCSFSIEEGEFCVIMGASGCGKSTLLRMIKKELRPFGKISGGVYYGGRLPDELDDKTAAFEIGFVGQRPEAQIVTDKVWHELAFGLESLGLDTKIIRRRVAEMASYFGIESWFHKNTSTLSGGQKQLLNLASVMAMRPKILLLDEPTAQLDPIAAADFITTVKKLNRDLGITVLLVEHRLEEALPAADRVLLMERGEIIFFDRPKKLCDFFTEHKKHPMQCALPAAARIFNLLGCKGDCPLTVREGRTLLLKYGCKKETLLLPAEDKPKDFVISLKNVRFCYDKNDDDILKDINLYVPAQKHLCILGGNGAGKTTLLNIMAGTLYPYRGSIFINGKKQKAFSGGVDRNFVAMLPQDPQTVFTKKTVLEDYIALLKADGYTSDDLEKRIKTVCARFDTEKLLNRHPYDLSGGEQQKAALCKILLKKPKLLLLDEPTKGMDPIYKMQLIEIIKDLINNGITPVTVTHDVEFAAEAADCCALMFDGEILSFGRPNEFFAGNTFYTTAANRIAGDIYENAVLCREVAKLALKSIKSGGEVKCRNE